jgi:hypothetical protein
MRCLRNYATIPGRFRCLMVPFGARKWLMGCKLGAVRGSKGIIIRHVGAKMVAFRAERVQARDS